jgi:hypothetical protein
MPNAAGAHGVLFFLDGSDAVWTFLVAGVSLFCLCSLVHLEKHYFSLQSFCSYQVIAEVFVLFINMMQMTFQAMQFCLFSPTNS